MTPKLDYVLGHMVTKVKQSNKKSEGIRIEFDTGVVITSIDPGYTGTDSASKVLPGLHLMSYEMKEEGLSLKFGYSRLDPETQQAVTEIKDEVLIRPDAYRLYHPQAGTFTFGEDEEEEEIELPEPPADRVWSGQSQEEVEARRLRSAGSPQEAQEGQGTDKLPSEK